MFKKIKRLRFWILLLAISAVGTTSMTGCIFVDRDHDHHDDHHDWR